MTGTVLWLIAIAFIVVGLILYFYGVLNEEKRKAKQRETFDGPLEDETKEVIVDSLTSPDPYLRKAMAKLLTDFDSVDEIVLQLLQEMAEGDKDKGVRETAVKTLKKFQ